MPDITNDDVPPDPVAAYAMGLRIGQDATRRVLTRLLGDPVFCRNGHSVWLHWYSDGKTRRSQGITIDGTVDDCDGDKHDDDAARMARISRSRLAGRGLLDRRRSTDPSKSYDLSRQLAIRSSDD